MLTAISFLVNPKRLLYVAMAMLLVAALWFVASFVKDKYAAEQAVLELTSIVAERDLTIATMARQAAQKEQAQKVADAARTVLENLRNGYDDLRIKIATAPSSEDAPIAPVLRNALDGLGGM